MKKTTVYLPERLKQALERTARRRHVSAAELLREAVARIADDDEAPSPKLPLFRARGRSIAAGVDRELAKGFGRR
jgi:Arc/MetJ-type ribon-helix-helix transcriptional regulator